MTAPADAVTTLAAALSVVERNTLGLVARGRIRYLGSFPADVAAVRRLTTLGLLTARQGADGVWFLDASRAGRAVLRASGGAR